MNLHLTATSERGKPVTKSGNEFIRISLVDETRKEFASFHIMDMPDGIAIINDIDDNKAYLEAEPKTAREAPCMNCGSIQKEKDIDYLGDSKWRCPKCK